MSIFILDHNYLCSKTCPGIHQGEATNALKKNDLIGADAREDISKWTNNENDADRKAETAEIKFCTSKTDNLT